MSAPDPYAGTVGEFIYADYKETVGAHHTGGASSWTRTKCEASLVWIVDAVKEAAAIRYALGYDAVETTGNHRLLRRNPIRHPKPGHSALYCTGVSSEPFAPDGTSAGTLKNFDGMYGRLPKYYAGYRKTKLTLHFEPLDHLLKEDEELPNYYSEWIRNTVWNLEPRTETLNIENVLTFAEGTGNTGTTSNPGTPVAGTPNQFTAPYAQILVKPDVTLTWRSVPSTYVEYDNHYPERLLKCMGKVNSSDFFAAGGTGKAYPAGTLLLNGVKIIREPNGIYSDTALTGTSANLGAAESRSMLTIDLLFGYFNPSKGFNSNSTEPINTNLGWVNCPWAGARNPTTGAIVASDRNAGKWFLCTRGGGTGDSRLLESYDYRNLFSSIQNPEF